MNLKKIILQLKQNETIIIDLWIQSKVFEEVLSRYIVPEYFRDNYAHLIFQYFIDVVEDKTKIGDCPSMKSFLHYCSIEGFKIDDVYRICAHFRHALSLYLIKNNL